MQRFDAQNEKITGWKGFLYVVLIILALFVDSLLGQLISRTISDLVGSLAFWGIGVVIALLTLRVFVMGYSYTLTSTMLRICHTYAKYERQMDTVYLSSLVSAGTPEEVQKYHPNARLTNIVLKRCKVEPMAIAFIREDAEYLYIIQVDEKMRAKLIETATANRKKGK